MAGIQGMPQISDLYGNAGSQAILDLFNTFIFFRSTDPQTTSWISKVLGEKDETEIIENLSYGANTIRDGVSLNQQTNTKPIVIPTEIQNLRDLEAYIKLPGNYPITKLKMLYQPQPSSKIEIFDFSLARGADHVWNVSNGVKLTHVNGWKLTHLWTRVSFYED